MFSCTRNLKIKPTSELQDRCAGDGDRKSPVRDSPVLLHSTRPFFSPQRWAQGSITAQNLESLYHISLRNKYRKACLNALDPGGHWCQFLWDRVKNDFIFIRDKSRTRAEAWKHTGSVITVKRENCNNGPRKLRSRNQIPEVRFVASKPYTMILAPLHTHTRKFQSCQGNSPFWLPCTTTKQNR